MVDPGKDVVVVVCATGQQGGSVIDALFKKGELKIRGTTRKLDSDRARGLAKRGVEMVKADLDDVASLTAAFKGAGGAYCVTNFFDTFSPEKEFKQASNLAQAAKAAGLKHVIWSTLEDTRKFIPIADKKMPILQNKYYVPHFDVKGEANDLFVKLGVPTTFLNTSFYWENFFGMGPARGHDGKWAIHFNMGDAKLPGIAVQDIGKAAVGILYSKPKGKFIGKTVGICGEQLTLHEIADAYTKVFFGFQIRYHSLPDELFRSFPFPFATELGNMFQFMRVTNDEFCAARPAELMQELNPEALTFARWLEANKKAAGTFLEKAREEKREAPKKEQVKAEKKKG